MEVPSPGLISPFGTYPELRQIELRGIVAQHRHQGRGPGLTEQATAEGGSWRVHGLTVPGDVAGRQADQHIIHIQGWPEHRLRKGRERSAAPTGSGELDHKVFYMPTSVSSFPFV